MAFTATQQFGGAALAPANQITGIMTGGLANMAKSAQTFVLQFFEHLHPDNGAALTNDQLLARGGERKIEAEMPGIAFATPVADDFHLDVAKKKTSKIEFARVKAPDRKNEVRAARAKSSLKVKGLGAGIPGFPKP